MRTRKDVYYRIGEAARILDISRSSLRNWERMGLLTPVRSQGLYRLYSRAELQKLLEEGSYWDPNDPTPHPAD